MRTHWKLVEYWSEVLHKDRHFFICSKCFYTSKSPVIICPNCNSEMSNKIILPKEESN